MAQWLDFTLARSLLEDHLLCFIIRPVEAWWGRLSSWGVGFPFPYSVFVPKHKGFRRETSRRRSTTFAPLRDFWFLLYLRCHRVHIHDSRGLLKNTEMSPPLRYPFCADLNYTGRTTGTYSIPPPFSNLLFVASHSLEIQLDDFFHF